MILNNRKSEDDVEDDDDIDEELDEELGEDDEEAEEENDEIFCTKKHKSMLAILTFCIYLATLIVSLTIYILNSSIVVSINKAASMALTQFNGAISIFYLENCIELKNFDFAFNLIDFVYSSYDGFKNKSYSHWRVCRSLCLRNLFLNLPSELFVFMFVDSFNFSGILMVVSR
jgi:uncharacterized membrane protein